MNGPDPSAAHLGACLGGRYDLVRQRARGETGDVYDGQDRVLHRPVAVVVHRAADLEERERFDTEVRRLATLDTPTPARIFDVGSCGGDAYVVLELTDAAAVSGALVGVEPAAMDDAVAATTTAVPIVARVGGDGSTDVTGELGVVPDDDAQVTAVQPIPSALWPVLEPEPAAGSGRPNRTLPLALGIAAAVLVLLVAAWSFAGDGSSLDVGPTTTSTVGTAAEVEPTPLDEISTTTVAPTTVPVIEVPESVEELFPEGFPFVDQQPPGPGKKEPKKEKGDD